MIRVHRIIAVAATLVLLLPAAAFANVMEYQLQYEPAGDGVGALLIVNAVVDPATALPQEVSIPVPDGATLLWSGELLGGDPSDDPQRATTTSEVDGVQVHTLTLEQSHTAQLELLLPSPSVSGDRLNADVSWPNVGEEIPVTASVIAEAGASDIVIEPARAGDVQTNDVGQTLHPLERKRLATGESYVIDVSWTRGASAAGGGDGASSNGLLPYVIGALVVAVVALAVVVTIERTRARRNA
jgi:hypothetical protein